MVGKKNYVIILASGNGNRFGGTLPKQFCNIAGKPVLMHSITVFDSCPLNIEIILVLHPEYIAFWKQLVKEYNFKIPHKIVRGGKERFYSAKNALEIISDGDDVIIGIHDGVRPFVSHEVILRTYSEAANRGAVIPVLPTVNPIRILTT
ncbi:IspD/TarI family cytidylyltransferase [Sphingobacterium cavernae]|uniref:IspD/TarI family cytidylyltransferase n=1 Tax=Sphingobacterium cavernae TaxID=2592657 RepID=UPI00123019FC|nr:2-C-methyl-D-erythritol 4-phosphate cytidylyltransferase [Sphingobacterium cavernae]